VITCNPDNPVPKEQILETGATPQPTTALNTQLLVHFGHRQTTFCFYKTINGPFHPIVTCSRRHEIITLRMTGIFASVSFARRAASPDILPASSLPAGSLPKLA
jgi:hypothetical protein